MRLNGGRIRPSLCLLAGLCGNFLPMGEGKLRRARMDRPHGMANLRFMLIRFFILYVFCLSLGGCATWYQRTAAFQSAVQQGDFAQAEKLLHKDKRQREGKNRILYLLNQGYVAFMLGHPEESNRAFECAERAAEERNPQVWTGVAAWVSNPEILPYRPEDFEVVMINVYKALNYLRMNQLEEALVEARKMNIRLQQLNDKYPDHKNRYQRDAFAHLVMGLIYDAAGKSNDAFIAYRNAWEVYQNDYLKQFGLSPPEQLKKDLLRTAWLCGMTDELSRYEKIFGMEYIPEPASPDGQAVLFWLNGFGPVKSEWGVTFTKIQRGDGAIVFHNPELDLAFPFFWGSGYTEHERNALADVNVVRAVFPQYTERKPAFDRGMAVCRGKVYPFQLAEDINGIAFKTLHDRMLREFSTSLLRVAVKQGLRYAASKENQWLGFAVGLANAFTEKADTRNWQTLPYSISYARMPLTAAENTVDLQFLGAEGKNGGSRLVIPAMPGCTRFLVHTTL